MAGNDHRNCSVAKGPTLSEGDRERLDELYARLREKADTFLGYPANMAYDYSGLERFLEFPLNNVGDPFGDGHYGVNTHEFERDVIDFFAQLFHIPKNQYWGYVTHGGTEGNMYRAVQRYLLKVIENMDLRPPRAAA